jgi:hypothetical protein
MYTRYQVSILKARTVLGTYGNSFVSVHFITFGSKFTIQIQIQEILISPDPDRKNYTYLQLQYVIAQDYYQ